MTLIRSGKNHAIVNAASGLWSTLYAAATTNDPIDVSGNVTLNVNGSPNYGLVTLLPGCRLTVSRLTSTLLNCAGIRRMGGSIYYIGSRAGNGGVLEDPYPDTISHTINCTGLRSAELAGNLADPINALPYYNRGILGEDGSQRFAVCVMPDLMRTKLGQTHNPGDTTLVLAPDFPAATWKAGTRLVVSDTNYPSKSGGIPGGHSEIVIVASDVFNSRAVPILRDPAVAGTGLQFRHFGQLQYHVPKALEGLANTCLSFTPHTWIASDIAQTLPNGFQYTGQMVLDAIAAGYSPVLDHRCGVGVLSTPGGIKYTGPLDSDRTTHGYGFSDMTMGANGTIDQREGIQFTNSGKAGQLGAYSGTHDHIRSVIPHGSPGAGTILPDVDATLNFVRKCTVENGSNRAFTIHATNGLPVEDCVAYNCLTHNIFQEDASEKNGFIRRNFMVKVGPVGYGKTAIKQFDLLFDNDIAASNQSMGGELATWKAGPAGYWLTHPTNIVEDNWVHGAYVGIWNAYPKRAFGASRDIANMSPFRLLPTSHKGNEALGIAYKAMLSGERQDQRFETGSIISFGDNTDSFGVNFGDVYQYGDDLIAGVGRTDAFAGTHDPIFQSANLGKTDHGAYGNQAFSPRYENWHVAGIRGGVNTFHNERLAIFGNSANPRFSFCGFFPNTLDDDYPGAQVSVMLSYGSTPLHQHNIIVGSPMGGWHVSDDELTQEGGPLSLWDYYLNALSCGNRGFFGVATNNLFLGANPGVMGMRLPPPCMFGVVPDFGAEYTAIYTPFLSGGLADSTLGPTSGFKLPADKHMFGYDGWWAFKALYITHNCTGVVDAPVMAGVSSGMNGVIIPPAYEFCGVQMVWARDASRTQYLLDDDGVRGGSPAVKYQVVDDADHLTLVTNAIWPYPKHHPGHSWPNMRHAWMRKGKTYRAIFDTADVPLSRGVGIFLQGLGSAYAAAGFHAFLQTAWDPAFTSAGFDAFGSDAYSGGAGVKNVDFINPVPEVFSLAALYGSTSMCFFIDAPHSLIHIHIYGLANTNLAVRINTASQGINGV